MDSWHGRLGVCFRRILTSSVLRLCHILLVLYCHELKTTSFLIQGEREEGVELEKEGERGRKREEEGERVRKREKEGERGRKREKE